MQIVPGLFVVNEKMVRMKPCIVLITISICIVAACEGEKASSPDRNETNSSVTSDPVPLIVPSPEKSQAALRNDEKRDEGVCVIHVFNAFGDDTSGRGKEPIRAMKATGYRIGDTCLRIGEENTMTEILEEGKRQFDARNTEKQFYFEIRADRDLGYDQVLPAIRAGMRAGVACCYVTAMTARVVEGANNGRREGRLPLLLPTCYTETAPVGSVGIRIAIRAAGDFLQSAQYEIDSHYHVDTPARLHSILQKLVKMKGYGGTVWIDARGAVRWKFVVEALSASLHSTCTATMLGKGVTGEEHLVLPQLLLDSSGVSTHGPTVKEDSLPRTNFFGEGDRAHNVVYVIDASGSMIDIFDALRREMIRSLSSMKESQYFHMIFLRADEPNEFWPRKLVPADRTNRKKAVTYLQGYLPPGQTNPVPAMRRAFQVLNGARKKGSIIYLLTDGRFLVNEKLLGEIRELNSDGCARIFTILVGNDPPAAVAVMQKIAAENNGRYVFVGEEDL